LKQLAGSAQIELDFKHGSYDATARALQSTWYGTEGVAPRLRAACPDRELAARLWRLTLECANHRGDTATSDQAHAAFALVLREGASLSMLADLLRVRNLAVVALQNRLPAEEGETEHLLTRLCAESRSLERIASNTVDLGVLLELCEPAPEPADGPLAPKEAELRGALGCRGAPWERNDREYGQCLGTVARSLAFAGHLDEALALLLRARARFRDSAFDLRFNAAVIARVELERARRGTPRRGVLSPTLELAGVPAGSKHAAVSALKTNPGDRFALDLLLRTLLWAPDAISDTARASWLAEIGKAPGGQLYPLLEMQRSHPTDLIARHAGELLARSPSTTAAARLWFELSLAVSERAPEGTLRRFSACTRALASGAVTLSGVPGSILNPTFEYR
jgi:hypothetical protein